MNPAAGNPLDERELTAAHVQCRRQMRGYVQWWRKHVPGYRHVRVEQHAFALGVRESRRIHGIKTLTADDVCGCREQPDAIGHGFWGIDIHDPEGSGYTTWLERKGQLPAGRPSTGLRVAGDPELAEGPQLPHPLWHAGQ